MGVGWARSRARSAKAGVLVVIATGALLGACADSGPAGDPSPSASSHENGTDVDEHDDSYDAGDDRDHGGPAEEVDFGELMDDPERFVGSRVRVTGNVFFLSECPPPGSSTSTCTLLGYLVHPDQHTFIASDKENALALAEDGARVGCDEGGDPRPACPGWTADAAYALEGTVEHQVLGGRETELIQLDVDEKEHVDTK